MIYHTQFQSKEIDSDIVALIEINKLMNAFLASMKEHNLTVITVSYHKSGEFGHWEADLVYHKD